MTKVCKIFLVLIIIAMSIGCATSFDKRGSYYKVNQGDTLKKIAKFNRVSVQDLAEWNNILNENEIQPGLKLYIPKVKYKDNARASRGHGGDKIELNKSRFIWPVHGKMLSPFGIRKGHRHDGIDIKGEKGDPIHAADSGTVAYSGVLSGYGNIIIVRHPDDIFTVYAHNSKNKVQKGEKVAKNEVIGYVGATGRATGPHLHFEVRKEDNARNPAFYLPEQDTEIMIAKGVGSKVKGAGKKTKAEVATKSEERSPKNDAKFTKRKKMMEQLQSKEKKK